MKQNFKQFKLIPLFHEGAVCIRIPVESLNKNIYLMCCTPNPEKKNIYRLNNFLVNTKKTCIASLLIKHTHIYMSNIYNFILRIYKSIVAAKKAVVIAV